MRDPTSNHDAAEVIQQQPVLFAVRALPIEVFGKGHGRHTRKFVLTMIVSHADPDGTNCYPGIALLCRECGLQQSGIHKVIKWLEDNRLLKIDYKAGRKGTNVYTALIPDTLSSGYSVQRIQCPEAPPDPIQRITDPVQASGPDLPIDLPVKKPTKARAPKNSAALFVLPGWVPVQAWNDFEEMRRKKGAPMKTARTKELIVQKLAELRDAGNPPADVLNQSTAFGYQGVFALKGGQGSRKPPASEKVHPINYRENFNLQPGTSTGKFR
jgi:hypothetical protein